MYSKFQPYFPTPGRLHYPIRGLHVCRYEDQVHDRRNVAEGVSSGPRPHAVQYHHVGRGSREDGAHGRAVRPA